MTFNKRAKNHEYQTS